MLLSEAELMVPAKKLKELLVHDKGTVVWSNISSLHGMWSALTESSYFSVL